MSSPPGIRGREPSLEGVVGLDDDSSESEGDARMLPGEEGINQPATALDRPRDKVANYLVTHRYSAAPANEIDHFFSGIMFIVRCKATLPVEFIDITSFHVRGELGPLAVYSTEENFFGKEEDRDQWEVHFDRRMDMARELTCVELDKPIRIRRGHSVGVYIHSRVPGDQGLAYSDERGRVTLEDKHMKILPGQAHTSPVPFYPIGPWGGWSSWRHHREFCGRLTYAVKYQLWSPEPSVHSTFPASFRELVRTMILCHRSTEGKLNMLPEDALYTILHLCSWDWAPGAEPERDDASFAEPEQDLDELPQYTRARGSRSMLRSWLRNLAQFEFVHADASDDDSDEDYVPRGAGRTRDDSPRHRRGAISDSSSSGEWQEALGQVLPLMAQAASAACSEGAEPDADADSDA